MRRFFCRYTVGDEKDDPSLFCRSGDLVTHSSHLPYGLQKREDPITQNLSAPKRVSFFFFFFFFFALLYIRPYTHTRLLSSPFYCASYKIFWISFFLSCESKKNCSTKPARFVIYVPAVNERPNQLYIENSHQYLHHYTHSPTYHHHH